MGFALEKRVVKKKAKAQSKPYAVRLSSRSGFEKILQTRLKQRDATFSEYVRELIERDLIEAKLANAS